jgi:ubiquinone/menaquinone biosynthesis C-methylase UbiE
MYDQKGENAGRVIKHFTERAESYDKGNWPLDNELLSAHTALIGNVNGKLVLDVACGTGIIGHALSKLGAQVIGIDISTSMLLRASERISALICGNMLDLPFGSGVFDLLVCRQGIHYIDPIPALTEMHRVLAKCGSLLISSIVPYGDEDYDWYKERIRIKKPEQVWIPTTNSLGELLKQVGFSIICIGHHQTTSRLSTTKDRTGHDSRVQDVFLRHHLSAQDKIKELYAMKFDNNDVEYKINWVILMAKAP